jgi:DnaJ-class molecular chaperone
MTAHANLVVHPANIFNIILMFSFLGGGGGTEEEEEVIAKGNDVIVELKATLEDMYMGGTLKVYYLCFFSLDINYMSC